MTFNIKNVMKRKQIQDIKVLSRIEQKIKHEKDYINELKSKGMTIYY